MDFPVEMSDEELKACLERVAKELHEVAVRIKDREDVRRVVLAGAATVAQILTPILAGMAGGAGGPAAGVVTAAVGQAFTEELKRRVGA